MWAKTPPAQWTKQPRASRTSSRRKNSLLPDAELAENRVEQVFGRRLSHHFADGVGRDAQVQRHEVQGQIMAERIHRSQRRLAGAAQRVLMPRIDHHLKHL